MTSEPDRDVAARWDAGALGCGELVIELRGRLARLAPGSLFELVASDPGAPADLPAWCLPPPVAPDRPAVVFGPDGRRQAPITQPVVAPMRAGAGVLTDGEQRRDNYASFVGGLLENCQLVPVNDLLPYVDDPDGGDGSIRQRRSGHRGLVTPPRRFTFLTAG